jgi:heat-inducible transcriptional repressor
VRVLEEKKRFSQLLHRQLEGSGRTGAGRKGGKVQIHIGAENLLPELKGLSIIATTYQLKDHPAGVLGIVGPKRMQYGKMVALVDFISDTVSRALLDWEHQWSGDE